MNSTTNSGRYILGFATLVIIANIMLIGFLFLNDMGVFKPAQNNSNEVETPISLPVSSPLSSPVN